MKKILFLITLKLVLAVVACTAQQTNRLHIGNNSDQTHSVFVEGAGTRVLVRTNRKWGQSPDATNKVSIAGIRTTNNINANSAIILDGSTNGISSTELLELGKAQRLQQEKGYCNRAVLKTSVADLKKSFPEYAALLNDSDSEFKQMLIMRGLLEKEINIAQSFNEVRAIAAKLPEQSILDARDADK